MTHLSGLVFQAVPGFEDHLVKELGSAYERLGPLFYASSGIGPVFWYQNVWVNPVKIEFESINEAASALRALGRNWAPCLFTQFRRGRLIESKLPKLPLKKRPFPWLLPKTPMGAFTLPDAHTLIASANCSSPFPGGSIAFEEDKAGPPSRAYLKLWEALTRCRKWPLPGETCLDAGASPGGWTWALSKLGASVIAVDRAPLEPAVAGREGVRFIKHDAFTLKPEDIGKVDWLFCDVICYPPRLLEWIEKWLASGLCENFICTIKMQGAAQGAAQRAAADGNGFPADFETPRRFAEISGSQVIHLWHNKHELTWIKVS